MNFEADVEKIMNYLDTSSTEDGKVFITLMLEKAFISGKQEAVNQAKDIIRTATI